MRQGDAHSCDPSAPCGLRTYRFGARLSEASKDAPAPCRCNPRLVQKAAARGARLRELRWKNSAWLATADTIAGWNGFEIRNAGSGPSPGWQRLGYAVFDTTGPPTTLLR